MTTRITTVAAAILAVSAVHAQPALSDLLPLKKGYAIVTCSPGPLRNAQGGIVQPAQVDPAGYVLGIVDVRNKSAGFNPGIAKNWGPDMYHGETIAPLAPNSQWTAARMGLVFGIATDRRGNIYASASSSYGSGNGQLYPDLFGSAGSGGIYKIDGFTGNVSDFISTNNSGVYNPSLATRDLMPNSGPALGGGTANPGLGNLAYDYDHDQLFVTNFEDGKIYRVTGLNGNAGAIAPAPYDPFGADNSAAGFAPLGERLWGVGYVRGRLYFSRWTEDVGRPNAIAANEIWSVAVNTTGAIDASTLRLELTVQPISTNYSNPISDIEFSSNGELLAAERGMGYTFSGAAPDSTPYPHQARVLKAKDTGTFNAPVWSWDTMFNAQIGTYSAQKNGAGGVDFAYRDENSDGVLLDCDKWFWSTGDHLCSEGTPACAGNQPSQIYGMQGSPLATPAVSKSYFVDFDGNLGTSDKNEQGDVDIYRSPCGDKGCVTISDLQIECLDKAAGTYQVTVNFTYQNIDPNETPAENIVVVVDGVPKNIALNPKLNIGDKGTFTFQVTGLPGGVETIGMQIHGAEDPVYDYTFCCLKSTLQFTLPDCRCFDATFVRTPQGLRLQITNNEITQPATFLLLDLRAPSGTVMSPTSFNMTPTPQGGTWLSPVLNFTPPLPPGATPTIFLTLHGKKRANGVYEECCSEQFTVRVPTLTSGSGVTGWVYADLDFDSAFGPRDTPLANVVVFARERSGRLARATTNAAGEYSIPSIEANQLVEVTLAALPASPAGQSTINLNPDGRRVTTPREGPVATAMRVRRVANRTAPPGEFLPNLAGLAPYAYPSKVVEFHLAESGFGELSLLDGQGQQIASLAQADFAAGDHIANFDPSTLEPGTYALRLRYKGEEFAQSFTIDGAAQTEYRRARAMRQGHLRVGGKGAPLEQQ